MPKSAVVQSRIDILDLATITRHLITHHDKPKSISEIISLAIQVLNLLVKAELFTSPTEAVEFMKNEGYGQTLKTAQRALAKQIAEEELLLNNGPPNSSEAAEISPETMSKLKQIREEKGTL